jgi:hypothetical protein
MDQPTPEVKSWTVKAPDGTVYTGVKATSQEEAIKKMRQGPQGPMTVKGSPTQVPRGSASFAGLPELAKTGPLLATGLAAGPLLASEVAAGPKKAPTSTREIIGDLVPAAVAALVPPARTLGAFGKTVGGNVLGRAAVEAGAEALSPTGQGPLSAGVKGAAKGVLPGLVQGGFGAALGPTADTLRAQKAMKALKGSVSPEVGAMLDLENPAALLKRSTPRAMTKAAGANLDKMEAEVSKALGNQKFTVGTPQFQFPTHLAQRMGPGGAKPPLPGRSFEEVRGQIKELREVAEGRFNTPELRGAAKKALAQAAQLESEMVAQMPPKIAQQYKEATARHAADMDAVRWVRALHKREALMGGVNPQDRPGLAEAERQVTKGGGTGSAAVHGGIGALEAAMGRGYGAAYHLARAGQGIGKTSPLRPASKVATTVPRISGALGGIGTAAGQTAVGRSKAYEESD